MVDPEREVEFAVTERVIFFTDAVIAIAITLLALALPVPDALSSRAMARSLAQHQDEFLAFLISFLVVARHWGVHRQTFRHLHGVPRSVITLNVYWLLLIILTPFTTRVLNVHVNLFSFGLYGALEALQFGLFSVMVVLILRSGDLHEGTDRASLHSTLRHTVPVSLGFAVSIPLYAVVAQWAFVVWFVVPVASGVVDGWARRRAKRPAQRHGPQ